MKRGWRSRASAMRPNLPRWQGEPLAGRLLIYPEQADIESDAAMRDTLMLARGVDAVVQCAPTLAEWLDMPTIRRGEALDGFAAAAPLRSLPYLLGWTLESLPAPGAMRREAERVGPHRLVRPQRAAGRRRRRARSRAGRDLRHWSSATTLAPTHLAARLGIPTILLPGPSADWLWGPRTGPSPWYPALEVLRADEADGLAARLARYEVCAATLRKRSRPRPRNSPPIAATARYSRPHHVEARAAIEDRLGEGRRNASRATPA